MGLRLSIPLILPAAALLWGCGSRDAIEEASPPVPAAATAIPTAAPGAQGAQFNAPAVARATRRPGKGSAPLHPSEPPDDPFETMDPPEMPDMDAGRPVAKPKPKGVSL